MIIHLNENTFEKMFLIESKNSKRAHIQTRNVIADRIGKDSNSSEVIEAEKSLESTFFGEGLRTDWFIVLEPNIAMWYYDSPSDNTKYMLQKYMGILFRKATTFDKPSEFVSKVREIKTLGEIREFVGQIEDENDKAERDSTANMKSQMNQNYKILGPLSFEEANKYGNYSNPNGEICYTQNEGTWKSPNYSNYNRNSCYLILRNDWMDVKPIHDGSEKNNGLGRGLDVCNAYDDYGLSMIFLFIAPNGKLHECNTRWNHDAKYALGHSVDMALNVTDISNLLGISFYKAFKHNNDFEIKFNNKIREITEALNNVDELNYSIMSELFSNFRRNDNRTYKVCVEGIWNLLDRFTRKFVFNEWFNRIIGTLMINKAIVLENLEGKYNYLRGDYKIISDEWFDNVYTFGDTCGIITRNDRNNIIDINGNLCLSEDVYNIETEFVGSNRVILNVETMDGKFGFFDTSTLTLLGDRWYDGLGHFTPYGVCPVKYENRYNFIDGKVNYLFKDWLLNMAKCSDSYNDGWLVLTADNKVLKVNVSGTYKEEQRSDFVDYILKDKPFRVLK